MFNKKIKINLDKNQIKKLIFSAIFIIIFISFIEVYSYEDSSMILKKGKNNVIFNLTNPIQVKSLVELNPKIEVISFKENNRTIGYVNIFNGIGENFEIKGGMEYEIITKDDSHLIVPSDK